jgi:hypothetical protein
MDGFCRTMIAKKYGICIQGIVLLHPSGLMGWVTLKNQMRF